MQDLRLVGVHDDSEHLLLSGAGGEIYRLPIDEALRVASSRTPLRQNVLAASTSKPLAPGERLSPKDIQQRVRGGASAAEVAEAAGVPIEHVERYEGPVLAEREHVALLARRVEVSDAIPSHDGYRSAFGDDPASLDEMVSYRLTAMGIDASTVEWDAWRRPDGQWAVTADFTPGEAQQSSVGESAPAQWVYNSLRKSIQNANRWAQLLSEIEPLDSPLPSRRLTAVADRPFDFETDRPEDLEETATLESAPSTPEDKSSDESDGLLDLLRARRGQRIGTDEDDDDALALLLTEGIPAAHPRNEDNNDDDAGDAADADDSAELTEQPAFFPALSLAPNPVERPAQSDDFGGTVRPDPLELSEGVSTHTREIKISAQPQAKPSEPPAKPVDQEEDAAPVADRRPGIKPKRSSVPSWDEIVFGTKTE